MDIKIYRPETGFTLLEFLIVVLIISILIGISLPIYGRMMASIRLNSAIHELSQQWKMTRIHSIGEGDSPRSICIQELNDKIQYAVIEGTQCETTNDWKFLHKGVTIDETNSTLRTVTGIAGNGGVIYRASWADTAGGMGGSYGQLGRITLIVERFSFRKCLFLYNVEGQWEIRENKSCLR